MTVNRTGLFYKEITLAAGYTAANIIDFVSQHNHLKIMMSNTVADKCEFVLNGEDVGGSKVDGKILEGETQTFEGLALDKIAIRGTGTARVWAWHQT